MSKTRIIEVPAEPEPKAQVPKEEPVQHEPFEDGIYFGLVPDETYHPDPALGSGDIKRLYWNPAEYWWRSPMNKLLPKKDDDSPFKTFGRAVHVHVLEGAEKFFRLYECEDTDEATLKTSDDIKKWLLERGQKPPRTKAEMIDLALLLDANVRIADVIKVRALEAGRTILKEDDYNRILTSSQMIAENPDLEHAFTGGRAEVAVFWTETVDGEPVRCKALFDYLKIRGIGDLKSTSNPKEMAFDALCSIRFAEQRMDIQAVHYMRAREFLAQFVLDGRVHGDHDGGWLRKVAAQEEYGFAHVFFQTTGAPSVLARSLSRGNPILDIAADHRDIALNNFVLNRSRYGDTMWLRREPIREWSIDELPAWWGRNGR